MRRSIGSPVLFTVVYTSLASAIYFSLGVIAGHALGLTPLVFLFAALLFVLTAMTYAEGASLHQDRGGSTVFARYAFNELVSFIAGWAILLDYIILIAVTAFSATQYLQRLLAPAGHRNRGAAARAGVHRDRRARQHPRLRQRPLATGRAAGRRRPAVAAVDRRDRVGPVLQPEQAARPDPPGQRAEVVGSRVRPDGRRDLLHQPGVRRRPGRGGADRPLVASSTWSAAARRR